MMRKRPGKRYKDLFSGFTLFVPTVVAFTFTFEALFPIEFCCFSALLKIEKFIPIGCFLPQVLIQLIKGVPL